MAVAAANVPGRQRGEQAAPATSISFSEQRVFLNDHVFFPSPFALQGLSWDGVTTGCKASWEKYLGFTGVESWI